MRENPGISLAITVGDWYNNHRQAVEEAGARRHIGWAACQNSPWGATACGMAGESSPRPFFAYGRISRSALFGRIPHFGGGLPQKHVIFHRRWKKAAPGRTGGTQLCSGFCRKGGGAVNPDPGSQRQRKAKIPGGAHLVSVRPI